MANQLSPLNALSLSCAYTILQSVLMPRAGAKDPHCTVLI